MGNRILYLIGLAVIVAAGYFLVTGQNKTEVNTNSGNSEKETLSEESEAPKTENPQESAKVSTETEVKSDIDVMVTVVKYDGTKYDPQTVTIKKGNSVTWVNNSDKSFWPASAKHPTHELYPVKGGCISSAFDACETLSPGLTYTFAFTEVGEWKYHDHINPSAFGAVVVEE